MSNQIKTKNIEFFEATFIIYYSLDLFVSHFMYQFFNVIGLFVDSKNRINENAIDANEYFHFP